MTVKAFLRWSKTAGAADRARAAHALANAYLFSDMTVEDRRAGEVAMTVLLDDPSPRVRIALAEALATSDKAPRAIVTALARDQIVVASRVVCFSPVLGDGVLVDIVAEGNTAIRHAVALRPFLSRALSAAICEVGEARVVADLLDNAGADIAAVSLRRIVERFADDVHIRARLLCSDDLPADVRQMLTDAVGDALANCALVSSALGERRAKRLTSDACRGATLHLAETVSQKDIPVLVEHLRLAGRMTPTFLFTLLCRGCIDVFVAAVGDLGDFEPARLRALLSGGRSHALRTVYKRAGMPAALIDAFVDATMMWRSGRYRDGEAILRHLIDRYAGPSAPRRAPDELMALMDSLYLTLQRENARDFANHLGQEAA